MHHIAREPLQLCGWVAVVYSIYPAANPLIRSCETTGVKDTELDCSLPSLHEVVENLFLSGWNPAASGQSNSRLLKWA